MMYFICSYIKSAKKFFRILLCICIRNNKKVIKIITQLSIEASHFTQNFAMFLTI